MDSGGRGLATCSSTMPSRVRCRMENYGSQSTPPVPRRATSTPPTRPHLHQTDDVRMAAPQMPSTRGDVHYGASFASATSTSSAGAPPRSFRMYPRGSFKKATSPFPFVGPHKASKAIIPKFDTTNDDMMSVQMK